LVYFYQRRTRRYIWYRTGCGYASPTVFLAHVALVGSTLTGVTSQEVGGIFIGEEMAHVNDWSGTGGML
jgi:hypothetical protein